VRPLTPDDHKLIVVGRPLAFSVYGSDRKLLLAAGHIVPNQFVRDGLARSGAFCAEDGVVADTTSAAPISSDFLKMLQADY
jgi:hypothetical protein